MENQKIKETLKTAVPCSFNSLISELIKKLDFKDARVSSSDHIFKISIGSDTLKIPYRIYLNDLENNEYEHLSLDERKIYSSIMTRHSNGYVRELHLNRLLSYEFIELWQIPFIILISGDYVLANILKAFQLIQKAEFYDVKKVLEYNPRLLRSTESRIISYWNEYYRYPIYGVEYNKEFNKFENYTGCLLIQYLRTINQSEQ